MQSVRLIRQFSTSVAVNWRSGSCALRHSKSERCRIGAPGSGSGYVACTIGGSCLSSPAIKSRVPARRPPRTIDASGTRSCEPSSTTTKSARSAPSPLRIDQTVPPRRHTESSSDHLQPVLPVFAGTLSTRSMPASRVSSSLAIGKSPRTILHRSWSSAALRSALSIAACVKAVSRVRNGLPAARCASARHRTARARKCVLPVPGGPQTSRSP